MSWDWLKKQTQEGGLLVREELKTYAGPKVRALRGSVQTQCRTFELAMLRLKFVPKTVSYFFPLSLYSKDGIPADRKWRITNPLRKMMSLAW